MNSNQQQIMESLTAFDIDKRREEFAQLMASADLHWRQKLIATYPKLFDSAAGVGILDRVRKGVANIKDTVMVIECLKAVSFDDAALIKRQKLVIPEPVEAD